MTRTRDNSRITVSSFEEQWGNRSEGQISENPPDVVSVIHPDVMTDVVTPNYKRCSARGDVINNPMTRWKGDRTIYPARDYVKWALWPKHPEWDQWVSIVGEAPPPHAFDPHLDQRVVDRVDRLRSLAITSAFANVGQPDIAMLTELAELRETLGFLSSPVRKMVNLTKRFAAYQKKVDGIRAKMQRQQDKWEKLPPRIQARRQQPVAIPLPKFRVGKFEATDVSSAWLAYRYGLMPLIYTFQDIVALQQKRLEGSPVRATARAKESERVDLTSSVVIPEYWDGNFYDVKHIVEGGCVVNVRAGVLYEVDATLLNQLGLKLDRVPMALYEAIPLSFVSDWFHNGAEVYDALTAEMRAGKILSAWTSVTIDYDVMFKEVQGPVTQGTGSASGVRSELRKGKWFERKLATVTDVRFKLRLELNSKRVADGLALIHTFLSTGKIKK